MKSTPVGGLLIIGALVYWLVTQLLRSLAVAASSIGYMFSQMNLLSWISQGIQLILPFIGVAALLLCVVVIIEPRLLGRVNKP